MVGNRHTIALHSTLTTEYKRLQPLIAALYNPLPSLQQMNLQTFHEPSVHSAKEGTQDVERKAGWLGSSEHTSYILQMLLDTPTLLPDAVGPKEAASTLNELLPIMKDKKEIDGDVRLVSDCCKFLVIVVRHISSKDGESSPSLDAAVRAIRHASLMVLAIFSKPHGRKFWSRRSTGTGDKLSVSISVLQENLRATWESCYSELSPGAKAVLPVTLDSMAKQMDAMVEKAVIFARHQRVQQQHNPYQQSLQRLDSDAQHNFRFAPFDSPHSRFFADGGVVAHAQDGHSTPQRSNSLPQTPPGGPSTVFGGAHITPLTASPFSAASLHLPSFNE